MSPTLGPGKTTWSECSRQYLDKFVLTPQATCVLGRSSHVNIIQQFIPSHQLPGQRFSLNDQCQFRFGPTARHYNGQPKREICRVIKCHVKPNHLHTAHRKNGGYYPSTGRSLYNPYPPKSTYNTHPALEGTDCGDQMVRLSLFTFYFTNAFLLFFQWCREGRCVSKSDILPIEGIEEGAPLGGDTASQKTGSAENNNNNDVDNYLISRTKYPEGGRDSSETTTETQTRGNAKKTNHHHHQHHNSAPKLNKLKPKPSPYHYKYNPTDAPRNAFGSRNTPPHNETGDSAELSYLSTHKYNPYNGHSTSSSSGWKPTRGRTSSTSPRPRHPTSSTPPRLPPVHGNWSAWSSFGPCISECVTSSLDFSPLGSPTSATPIGIMTSLRRCANPVPLNGGAYCKGADTKVKLCNAYQVSLFSLFNYRMMVRRSLSCRQLFASLHLLEKVVNNGVDNGGQ